VEVEVTTHDKSDDPMSPIDVARMLEQIDNGGWLVSSARCSEQEIARARAESRFYVSSDGCGYVVRPPASLPGGAA
jgi:hypothetical protein